MPNAEHIEINQFAINNIIQVPCDSVFLNLLPQTVVIKRAYDKTTGVRKTNEYGEVVMTYTEAQIVGTDIPARIDSISQRGKTGFVVETQGGEVFATFQIFMCPEVDVVENDSIFVGTREYQVILVDELYGASSVHHLELLCRRVDNL
jgi:hypothetical protein